MSGSGEMSSSVISPGFGPLRTYSPVIGAVTTAPTYGAGNATKAGYVDFGKFLYIMFSYSQTGAGSAGTGIYLFPVPSATNGGGKTYTIDTTLLASTAGQNRSIVGSAGIGISTTNAVGYAIVYNTTNLAIVYTTATNALTVASGNVDIADASAAYGFCAWVPIL